MVYRIKKAALRLTGVKTTPDQKTSINYLSPHRRGTAATNPTCILRAGSAVSKYARAPGCGLCAAGPVWSDHAFGFPSGSAASAPPAPCCANCLAKGN